MNKMKFMFAVSALVLLAGCAARSVEQQEMTRTVQDQRLHLGELVSQVRSAAHALEAIFGPSGLAGRSDLRIESVTLSMEVMHAQDEDGHLAAVVSASDDESRSIDDKVVMTLHPTPSAGRESDHPLADTYRDYRPCALGNETQADQGDPGRVELALVQASMAAVDAYLCAAKQSSDAGLALDGLTVTLSIDALRTETEGLILRLGNLSLGAEEVHSAESVATVEIDFSRPSVE